MKITTVNEAKLVIETFHSLTKTELHPDAIWRMFGKLAAPALYEFLQTIPRSGLDLERLERELDEALNHETPETLKLFFEQQRAGLPAAVPVV